MMSFRVSIYVTTLLVLLSKSLVFAESSTFNPLEKFTFFPEVHSQADIRRFVNRKTEFQRTHHFIEATLWVEPLWLSFDSILYLATAFDVNLGMGHTPKNVVFDPMDVFFGFTPFLEARFEPFSARLGLDHRCFHEIDQKELPTVYWNMLFVSLRSRYMRMTDFAQSVLTAHGRDWKTQSALSFRAGYYMKEFFGIVRESSVDYENDRRVQFDLKGRALLFRTKQWAFTSEAHALWGGYRYEDSRQSDLYWRQTGSIQALRRSPSGKLMYFFVRGTFDDMPKHRQTPRFTKTKLIELGVGVGL